MSDEEKKLLEKEGTSMIEPQKEAIVEAETPQDPFTKAITEAAKKGAIEALSELKEDIKKVQLTGSPRVQVEFPEVQKVRGILKILETVTAKIDNFPLIQKITGTVKALVDFPEVQKVALQGDVNAKVEFPDIQKVDVHFPDTQKIDGMVAISNLPIGHGSAPSADKADPTHYIPVRLTNGRQFYEVMSQSVQSSGRVVSALERLIASQSGASGSNVIVTDIKDGTGDSVMDAANNAIKVNIVAGGAGNGAILDGVDAAIKATVFDYTNSNPVAVSLVDTSGNPASGGDGAITDGVVTSRKATVGSRAASNPLAVMLVDQNGVQYPSYIPLGPVTISGGYTVPVSGVMIITGNVADQAADAGNPVKIGGRVNSTLPTYTDGQRADAQFGTRGSLKVELMQPGNATAQAYAADNADGVAASSNTGRMIGIARNTVYNAITSSWDRLIGNATDGLLVNLGVNNDVGVYGNVTISGFTNLSPLNVQLRLFDGANFQVAQGDFANGLLVNLGANNDVTVSGSFIPHTMGQSILNGVNRLASAIFNEDTPHTTGDPGIMTLAVRNDSGAVLAGSDGDYIPFTVDATGALRTDLNGTVSANNSSTATLTANSVFTGTSDDALNYNEIRVSVFSNVASATDGLSIQQSSDNSNWDITDTYTIPAGAGKTYSVPRQARYLRVVYTNGTTNQGSFRLQVILNRLGTKSSSQRTSDGYSNENDLEENWVFQSLYNGRTWDRATGSTQGANTVPSADILTHSGNIALAVLRQPINVSSNGQILISGQNSRRVRVIGGMLLASAATSFQVKSNNNSDATGPMPLIANEGFNIPYSPTGNFDSQVGESLTVILSAGTVGGWLAYVYI